MIYRILKDITSSGKLFVPSSFFKDLNLKNNTKIILGFGVYKYNVEVVENLVINKNQVILSSDIADKLQIPLDLQYQIIINENVIHIGPFIGLLLARTNSGILNALKRARHNKVIISPQGVNEFTRFTLPYNNIHGVLFIFSLEGIDFKKNCVEGYFYKPNTDISKHTWCKAVLPVPNIIYRRIYITNYIRNKLIKITNSNMFNSHYYNKWNFWEIASKYSSIKKHLPQTRNYTSFDDLEEMVVSYSLIFLKLKRSALANGLIRVEKKDNCYIFQRSHETAPIVIEDRDLAKAYVTKISQGHQYLIQQGIDVLKYDDRCTSLRVIMQKNESKNWNCTGICPRIGIDRGICSNFHPAHYNLSFEEFFKNLLNLNAQDIARKKEDIINICIEVCKAFDKTGGLFGDIGIDIGIDNDLNIWIFEVNERHHHHVPLKIEDEIMFNNVKCNPIKYAATHSGFNIVNV
jgi:hypothetical protein